MTVHAPLAFRKRRGRKVLIAPEEAGYELLRASLSPRLSQREVTPAVRALARAFRWRKLLETGAVATIHEIAVAETINPSYVSRVLRLTLLAPDVVEVGMGTGAAATLDRLMLPFPIDWCRQN